jgi:hypothetical protein
MEPMTRRIRVGIATAGLAVGLLAGCGGEDSESAEVGACIDAENQVVDCSSAEAEMTLVSDQSEADAIACVQIGEKPQIEVEVDGTTYCAEEN